MARRVFFSFHYENDIFRASVVRNSWIMQPDRETAGFWDAAAWESVKRNGDDAVKRWIRTQLENTSVTVVLIGSETYSREYVQYEIQQSWDRGNGLIGVYINNIKDMRTGETSRMGFDPFLRMNFSNIKTYDWIANNGYNNLGSWVEEAATRAQARRRA